MSTPANPLSRKPRQKKPKTDMFVTPGWTEDEPTVNTFEPQGPGQQRPSPATDKQRKLRKLQRA
jgi:hypothetical protein